MIKRKLCSRIESLLILAQGLPTRINTKILYKYELLQNSHTYASHRKILCDIMTLLLIWFNQTWHCRYIHLFHCDNTNLGQYWLRYYLDAWWHQAITRNKVDSSLVRFCSIHLRAILQWTLKPLFTIMRLNSFSKISVTSPIGQLVNELHYE